MPLWRHVPGGSVLGTRDHVVDRHARAAAGAIAIIPASDAVSATNTLGAHLSARHRVLSFPLTRDVRWVAVDTTRPSYLDEADAPEKFATALRSFQRRHDVRLVRSVDGVLVYRIE